MWKIVALFPIDKVVSVKTHFFESEKWELDAFLVIF
jgi:hypothetical protein